MTVNIIVLHYRKPDDTIDCLKSIAKLEKSNIRIKILLIDNNPNDIVSSNLFRDLHGMLKQVQHDIDLEVIKNRKNLGFAGGINIGIKEALKDKDTDYILILNNDTILPPLLLTELLRNPADITAPVVKFKWDNQWKYDFGGKVNWNIGRTYHLETNNWAMKQFGNETIDYVSGCCLLVKRRVFEEIGLFDERFFFYFEDADFCLRAKKAGFNIMVNPNISIYHKLGRSIGRWSNRAIFYNLLGNFLFITKNLGFRIPIGYIYLLLLTGKIIINRLMSFRGQ
jgi:GT2 family glycosyltransferase